MTVSIFDPTTRAAFVAAANQQAQCDAVVAPWAGGNVIARVLGSGGVLRQTVTLGPWTIAATTPREVRHGARLAYTTVTTGDIASIEYRTSGGALIFTATAGEGATAAAVDFAGPIRNLCGVTLSGAVFTAQAALPPVSADARMSFWGQSNAEGSALRSGISAITADPTLVAWDDGTNPFTRVMFWNGSAYAQYVPGTNHGTLSTLMGPEFGMAVRWMRETTTGILYMDKAAWGGTSIDAFQPPSALRWNDSIARRTAQNAWLAANGVTIDPLRNFWLWSQGEADSANDQAWYQPRMQAIVDALEANGILSYRGVLTDIPTGSPRFNAGISAAKQAVADTTAGLVVKQIEPAFPTFFEADNLHLNARGQVQRSFTAYSFFFDAPTITV